MSSTRRVSIELPCLRKSRSPSYSDDISDAPYVGSDCATDSPASVESVRGAYYRSSPSPCSKPRSSFRVEELSKTWGFGEVDPLGAREPPVLNSNGSINEELYGNLIPLMETFMDQKENQRALLHHAPLVYTRAPHRESPAKKELPAEKLKKNKQQRASPKSNGEEAKAEEGPIGRATGPDGHAGGEPDLSMKLNKAELLKIQSQVEELKRKVRDKEEILQSIKQSDNKVVQEVDRAEVLELRTKIEGLQKELLRRDFLLHSVQHQLFEKHAEIADMKLILEGLQNDVLKRDHRVSLMENHLDELRFEVAALRYQSQVAENRGISQLDQTSAEDGLDDFDGNMENARRRYLAAVIAARNKPVDESFALAAEFRNQLRGFIPQLSQALPE